MYGSYSFLAVRRKYIQSTHDIVCFDMRRFDGMDGYHYPLDSPWSAPKVLFRAYILLFLAFVIGTPCLRLPSMHAIELYLPNATFF